VAVICLKALYRYLLEWTEKNDGKPQSAWPVHPTSSEQNTSQEIVQVRSVNAYFYHLHHFPQI